MGRNSNEIIYLHTFFIYRAMGDPPVAHAQQCTSLVYHGSPFTAVSSSANNGLPITSPVTGLITLAAPLPMNATAYTVAPAAWDFTTQNSELTSTNGWFAYFYYSTSFQFTTVNGVITDWKVHLSWDNGPGTLDMYVIDVDSVAAGDAVNINFANVTSPGGPMNVTGSSAIAGTWTCAPVPPVDPDIATIAGLNAQIVSLNATIVSLNAQIVSDKSTISSLNATIVSLQAQLKAVPAAAPVPTPACEGDAHGGIRWRRCCRVGRNFIYRSGGAVWSNFSRIGE